MTTQYANKGEQVDLSLLLNNKIIRLENEEDKTSLFDSGIASIDWSAFSWSKSFTETVKSTDTKAIDLGGASAVLVYLEVSAPVILEYVQDGETRKYTVSPLVIPTNYFSSGSKSPSQQPKSFQKGVFIVTGTSITSLTIKGVATNNVVADVMGALAGYR